MITLETLQNYEILGTFDKTPANLDKFIKMTGCTNSTVRAALDNFSKLGMIYETSDKIYLIGNELQKN